MRGFIVPFSLFLSLILSMPAFSCPSGHYEQCLIPRPFGGCAQKVCIPNGGSISHGLSGALKTLSLGIVELNNEKLEVTSSLGISLGQTAVRINWPRFEKIDWASAAFVASFLANGAACVASEGSSPGIDFSGSSIVCSENACACAAISLVAAIRSRSNLSEQDRQAVSDLMQNAKFTELLASRSAQAAITKELMQLEVYENLLFFDSNGQAGDQDGNDTRLDKPISHL